MLAVCPFKICVGVVYRSLAMRGLVLYASNTHHNIVFIQPLLSQVQDTCTYVAELSAMITYVHIHVASTWLFMDDHCVLCDVHLLHINPLVISDVKVPD